MDTDDLDYSPPFWSRWPTPVRWLAAVLGVVLAIAGLVVAVSQAVPDRRPVVLSVYCTSSAVWVSTLAPLIESQSGDGSIASRQVAAGRIRAAYERRCPTGG